MLASDKQKRLGKKFTSLILLGKRHWRDQWKSLCFCSSVSLIAKTNRAQYQVLVFCDHAVRQITSLYDQILGVCLPLVAAVMLTVYRKYYGV